MKSAIILFFFFTFSISLINFQTDAYATEVVPPANKNTSGNVTFLGPLATSARTYQLLIHADILTSFIGKNLTAISLRSTASASNNWPLSDVNISEYRIYLSDCVDPANRSLDFFADNVVGPQKQVRGGALFIPANSYTFGNSPNEFGPEILFDSNYLYSGGNLLIEIRHTGTGTSRSVDALSTSTPGYGNLYSACWKSGDTATYSALQGNFSIVKISTEATNLNLSLSAFIEGRYNSSTNLMVSDTANVYLHSDLSPYIIVDSSVSVIDASGASVFNFNEALNGVNYYIDLRHRNSIETWSATANSFSGGILNYSLSSSSAQAYGSNMTQVDNSPVTFAVYSGDITQDGTVDLTDVSLIDNDAFNFETGYLTTDINGDLVVDVTDAVYADNNAFNFVSKVIP